MTLKVKQIEHIKKLLDTHTYMHTDNQGNYYGEIEVDYRDELDDETIQQIVESKTPMDTFSEIFDDWDTQYEYDYIFEQLEKYWDEEIFGEYEKYEDRIRDWIYDNVYFNLPYDHYLKQSICVNIVVDTGDENYDYTCNNFMSYNRYEGEEIQEESSILWLVRQQGYTKEDLEKVRDRDFDNKNKFLDSIETELINPTSHMNSLVFLVKMTLKDFLDYAENPKDITVSKDTNCGLVDFWQGAGSVIDIQLEKDVTIPKDFVKMHVDGCRGYGIRDIYGMMESAWHDTIIKEKEV